MKNKTQTPGDGMVEYKISDSRLDIYNRSVSREEFEAFKAKLTIREDCLTREIAPPTNDSYAGSEKVCMAVHKETKKDYVYSETLFPRPKSSENGRQRFEINEVVKTDGGDSPRKQSR